MIFDAACQIVTDEATRDRTRSRLAVGSQVATT